MHLNVAGCYIEFDGKFLMLKRRDDKSQGGLWGMPAGKIDAGESPVQGVIREIKEEAGITIDETNLSLVKVIHYDFGEKTVDMHLFSYKPEVKPEVTIEPNEHTEFDWFSIEDARNHQQLMHGVIELLDAVEEVR